MTCAIMALKIASATPALSALPAQGPPNSFMKAAKGAGLRKMALGSPVPSTTAMTGTAVVTAPISAAITITTCAITMMM